MFATIAVVFTVAAPQSALASWVLRQQPPPLGRATTGRDTATTGRDTDLTGRVTVTRATKLRRATTAAALIPTGATIHTKDTAAARSECLLRFDWHLEIEGARARKEQ